MSAPPHADGPEGAGSAEAEQLPASGDSDLLSQLLEDSDYEGCPRRGESIVIALSGGLDSIVLLHLLHDLRAGLDLTLRAAHLDHGLREDSAEDAKFCADLCAKLDIEYDTQRVDVSQLAASSGLGVEAAGRTARYDFLDQLRVQHGIDLIATAHHADDQAETLLLNACRGSGLGGLRGIVLRSADRLRPLLAFARVQIELEADRRELRWREDPSNRSAAFLRNRARHELMPLVRDIFGPGAPLRLAELARRVDGELSGLERLADIALAKSCRQRNEGRFLLDRAEYLAQDPTIRFHVLRSLVRGSGALRRVQTWNEMGYSRVDQFAATAASGKRTPLPGGGWLHVDRETLEFEFPGCESAAGAEEFELLSESLPPSPEMSNFSTGQCAYFDADSIEMPLRLRTAEAGDRMRPQGAASQKALVSLLAERGVPRQHRAKTLVVEAAGKIIWAVDLAIDADSLPTAQTHRMLKLTLRPRQIASN